MKTLWKEICAAIFLGAILPGMILNISAAVLKDSARQTLVSVSTEETESSVNDSVSICLRNSDGIQSQMKMNDYLTGVLLGEMPAEFEMEALKAQAVAARTYTAKAVITGGKHGDGSVCADSACCQAYLPQETYLLLGGTEENLEKIHKAVLETTGLVLVYDGSLIEATYFSCSGGSTEDAAAVWGTDYPYLQAVASPGEEEASHYSNTLAYDMEVFQKKLGREIPGSPASWFGEVTYTPGGGVAEMMIGGESYKGTTLRSLLGLPSTAFTAAVEGNTIVITTRGYGHRVGMSQYGADAMAVNGSTFRQILAHYYPGAQLIQLDQLLQK